MIATTVGGPWFGFMDSMGAVGLVTPDGIETPSYPERRALREILTGPAEDPEG